MKLEHILGEKLRSINESNWQELKDIFDKKGATFILGAGVSIPAGLPSWDGLLASMWGRILETDIYQNKGEDSIEQSGPEANILKYSIACQQTREELRNQKSNKAEYRKKVQRAMEGDYKTLFAGMNLLEIAEYINNYVKQNMWLTKGKRDVRLCDEVISGLLKSCIWIEEDKAEFAKRQKGGVLDELAGLLSEEREKPSCNVITYNYDNLLEFFLKENYYCTEGKEMKVFCEEDVDKVSEYKKINIYHPHGYLKVIEDGLERKDTEKIILTESSYYRVEQKAYRWENSVQAKAILDTSCIFIGFSGQDYNFRRMIKNIAHEDNDKSNKHFIFFCVDPFVEKLIGEEADKRLIEQYIKEKTKEGIRTGMEPDKLSELICRSVTDVKSDSEYRKKWEVQIDEIMKEDNFAYENVQLLYFLYAQYMYWTRYGIVPIWTTFEELPERVKRMRKNSIADKHYRNSLKKQD